MAKSKNATALFEVIHTAKRPPKASPTGGGVPTPKWWAKGTGKAVDAARPEPEASARSLTPADAPEPTTAGTRKSWLSAVRRPDPHPPAVDHDVEPITDGIGVEPAADDEAPKVVITRYYPPDEPERTPPEDEPAPAEAERFDDEDAPAPVAVTPPPAEAKQSWAQRRAAVAAERATVAEPPAAFDPTANVAAADLRSERRVRPSPPPPRPAEVYEPDYRDREPAPERRPRRSAGPTPSALKPAVDPAVLVDRNAGEVRIRLSYGGAVAAGAILLVVLIIAYLFGQRSGSGTESVAEQPPTASTTTARPAADDAAPAVSSPPPTTLMATGPAGPVPPAAAPLAPPAAEAATPPAKRQVGMMYVTALYYADHATAVRAAAFLDASGIPCSVVPGPAGGALPSWFGVIGLRAFSPDEAHTPAVHDYLARMAQLGPKFSPQVYNRFKPQTYVWSEADAHTP